MKKIIVGVSGGSDSMALLDTLKKEKKYEIIVNHINYHFRKESTYDEKIVRSYCTSNNLVIEVLDVNDEILNKYKHLKNKQSLAREIRYDFFIENSNKYESDILYLAHHKDDFIETAIMQEERSKNLYFYGIAKKINFKNLKVNRPFIEIYKEELISYCKKNNLNFAIDITNFKPIYERNRIRIELSKKTPAEKDKIFNYYKKINLSNEKKRKKVESIFELWEEKSFNYSFLVEQKEEIRKNLLYRFLIVNNYFIKINNNKIEGLSEFLIKGDNQKSYRLSEDLFLSVEEDHLIIKEK